MPENPQVVQMSLSDFDRNQLPESQRGLQGDEFRRAVQDHLSAEFVAEGGAAEVVVTQDLIIIRWSVSSEATSPTEQGISFLKQGAYDKGMALLRLALRKDPEDVVALFNLGMALSDKGVLDEAVDVLEQCLAHDPDHVHAWVALGVAHARKGDDQAAVDALQNAVALDPDDGFSRMNLGAIQARLGRADEAISHLKLATRFLPSEARAWLNLGMSLEKAGETDDADDAYREVIRLEPTGALARAAEEGRSRIVEANFRNQGPKLRPDALAYCLGALQRFEGMAKSDIQRITFEIAMLGTRGLQINDPAEQYKLSSIPGNFSGLHLLCIEYVGFKLLDPSSDIGFDLSAEFEEARRIHGNAC